MNKWLRRDNFEGRITLPTAVKVDMLDPYVLDLEETVLPALLTQARFDALTDWLDTNPYGQFDNEYLPTNDDRRQLAIYNLVVAYLVYASWSFYVQEGAVQTTQTGQYIKTDDDSDPVSDRQRAELYKTYRDRAEVRATKIRQLIADQACAVPNNPPTLGSNFTTVRGRTSSRFD